MADEALLGALDALTGNCHPDCQYADAVLATNPTSQAGASGVNGSVGHGSVSSVANELT